MIVTCFAGTEPWLQATNKMLYKSDYNRGHIAQPWLERSSDKRKVGGSSPPMPTRVILSVII